MAVVRAGLDAGREHAARRRPVEGIHDQRGLAAAGDAGDAGEGAQPQGDVDGREVVRPRAAHRDPLALLAGPRRRRDRDRLRAAQVLAGQAFGLLAMIASGSPSATISPPCTPAPGPMSTT